MGPIPIGGPVWHPVKVRPDKAVGNRGPKTVFISVFSFLKKGKKGREGYGDGAMNYTTT
jgi:hypothetical protein